MTFLQIIWAGGKVAGRLFILTDQPTTRTNAQVQTTFIFLSHYSRCYKAPNIPESYVVVTWHTVQPSRSSCRQYRRASRRAKGTAAARRQADIRTQRAPASPRWAWERRVADRGQWRSATGARVPVRTCTCRVRSHYREPGNRGKRQLLSYNAGNSKVLSWDIDNWSIIDRQRLISII